MTFETVPALSVAGMAIAMLVSFALPIALFIYSKKKLHAKTAPFFIGKRMQPNPKFLFTFSIPGTPS